MTLENELTEALQLALNALEAISDEMTVGDRFTNAGQHLLDALMPARAAIANAKIAKNEPVCNPHLKAPHGFSRNSSHSAGRYVCECEGWDAWEAGYSEGMEAGSKIGEYMNVSNELQAAMETQPAAAVSEPAAKVGTPEQAQRFLEMSMKPEQISDDRRIERLQELLSWFSRLIDGHANPKWLREHAYELAYAVATTPLAAPLPEPLTTVQITEGCRSLGIGSYQTLAAAFKAGIDFAEKAHNVQYVGVFDAGVRFAEKHYGIGEKQ